MNSRPQPPPTLVRRFFKANAATLGGVVGYAIAVGVAFASIGVLNTERGTTAMARYGSAVADELAHHAVEPLLRRDRIQLGLLTNRLTARPEVRRIVIGTVDERLFVVAGRATTSTAPTYVRPITVEDTVAGDVTVTLNPDIFVLPLAELLDESWQFVLAGLAVTVFVLHFATRPGSRRRSAPRGTFAEGLPRTFVVAACLPPPSVSWSAAQERLLASGMAIGRRVANLYAGHVAALSGSGIVLVFPVSGTSDRCFEVVCAALLTRRLLSASPTPPVETGGDADPAVDQDATNRFRYGVDLLDSGVPIHGNSVQASAVSNVVMLAALAAAGELVLGEAAFENLDRPERVELEQLDAPPPETPSSQAVIPRGKIRGITREYDALLARQAEVIAKASTVT